MTPEEALRCAVYIGARSPCCKSKRGVVIFTANSQSLDGEGFNAPPSPFVCTGDEACRAVCRDVCVHAEQEALLSTDRGGDLLHVKVVDGEPVPSGPPSCVQCSKLILASGRITRIWLYEDRGNGPQLYSYSPGDFHRETLRNLGLPCVERVTPS